MPRPPAPDRSVGHVRQNIFDKIDIWDTSRICQIGGHRLVASTIQWSQPGWSDSRRRRVGIADERHRFEPLAFPSDGQVSGQIG